MSEACRDGCGVAVVAGMHWVALALAPWANHYWMHGCGGCCTANLAPPPLLHKKQNTHAARGEVALASSSDRSSARWSAGRLELPTAAAAALQFTAPPAPGAACPPPVPGSEGGGRPTTTWGGKPGSDGPPRLATEAPLGSASSSSFELPKLVTSCIGRCRRQPPPLRVRSARNASRLSTTGMAKGGGTGWMSAGVATQPSAKSRACWELKAPRLATMQQRPDLRHRSRRRRWLPRLWTRRRWTLWTCLQHVDARASVNKELALKHDAIPMCKTH